MAKILKDPFGIILPLMFNAYHSVQYYAFDIFFYAQRISFLKYWQHMKTSFFRNKKVLSSKLDSPNSEKISPNFQNQPNSISNYDRLIPTHILHQFLNCGQKLKKPFWYNLAFNTQRSPQCLMICNFLCDFFFCA